MKQIKIYHNPKCGTSRNTLAMIRNSGEEPEIILYLENPPTRAELLQIVKNSGDNLRDFIRSKEPIYKELGLDNEQLKDDELIEQMLKHPVLINRPIVITSIGTKLCRPSEVVLDLLPQAQKGAFTKEDGEMVINEKGERV